MPATKKKAKVSKKAKKAPVAKKKVTKKAVSKKAVAKKTAVKKKAVAKKAAPKKKAAAKKPVAKKASSKKAASKKPTVKKTPAAKPAAKKAPTKKAAAKKSTSKKSSIAAQNLEGTASFGIEPYKPKKGEEYMNDAQADHFREILNAWKKELMHEVDRTVHHMQDDATHFPDPNDRATQESEFSLELRTRDRERKLIRKIDSSLSNIDNEEYGFCESCGVEIGLRRLEARPTATQCIDCKMLDEIREKQWS